MKQQNQNPNNQKQDEDLLLHIIKQINLLREDVETIKQKTNASESNSNSLNGYVSEKDAMSRFKKSHNWFWERRRDGHLPFVKVGKTVYYKEEDLNNFLLGNDSSTHSPFNS